MQPKQSTSQSAVAVERTGTENEGTLFNLQSAEGRLGFMRQLSKGCLISLIVSFTGFKISREGKP